MRLRSIGFEPFGTLRGVKLDFAVSHALNIVWGQNEAGKSTSLRGIVDFFFGIAKGSADQHVRGLELRIRAHIVLPDGRDLELVRRKGTKDPLRDGATDAAVPELALSRWLGGVDRDTFKQLHALDHVRLREGADSILRGKGRLGELMLEATTGTTGLVERLQSLHEEARALYRPRKSTELQIAIEGWKSSTDAMNHQSLSHVAWEEQQRGIAETRRRVSEAEGRLREARADLARIEKLLRLEDPMAKLRNRRARRAQLGEVADVKEGTAARRDELVHELDAATAEAEHAEAELPRRELEREAAERRASAVASSFDRMHARELHASIDAFERSLRSAMTELDEIGRARDEALQQVGPPPDGVPWIERSVDSRSLARAEACAAERRAARGALAIAERTYVDAEARAATIQAAGDEVGGAGGGSPGEATALAAAIAAGRRASAAATALDGLVARELDLLHRLAPALAATGARDVGALAVASVPDPAAVDEELRRRSASAAASAAIERDRAGAAERAARAAAELAPLLRGSAVPSEAELAAARRRRDEEMGRALEALDGGSVERSRHALREVERASHAADAIADRLRHEAARVEHVASVEIELRDARQAAADLERRLAEAHTTAGADEEAFGARWPALAGFPLEAARAWLSHRSESLAAAAELAATRERADELRRELADATHHLARIGVGMADATSKLALDGAVASAEGRLDELRASERRREEREAAQARATSDRDAAARGRDHLRALDEAAEEAWRAAVGAHGLGASATLEEAASTLASLAHATRETARHARVAERVAGLESELATARRAWSGATSEAGLADVPPDEVMARADAAREARAEIPLIEEAIAQRRDVARSARSRAGRATARLADLAQRAGVPGDRLLAAEERARDARALEREIATLEATIIELTESRGLGEAEERLRDVDYVVTSDNAEQLRADIETLEASRTRDLHDLGAQMASLDEMERGGRGAADLEEIAQAHLTRARGLARRAAVARAAVVLFEREVERHRAEREGPVLRRASELFRILTARHWEGLRVGEGEDGGPEIRCFEGQRELGVNDLSDGTRDQLYLALRLAAVEHHATTGVALPLVLDDVLVHFDDERTEAAIVALADVAKTVQVLLFTHEQRIAEIARRVLQPGDVSVQELGRTP